MTICTPLALQEVEVAPPSDLRDWDFSLARSTGLFRWRSEGGEWMCHRAAGQAEVLKADGETGHMVFRCKLLLQKGVAYTYVGDEPDLAFENMPRESCPIYTGAETYSDYGNIPVGPSHYRLCYNRKGRNYRVRDERTGKLWLVDGYRGIINLNWFSGAVNLGDEYDAHIFHDGPIVVDFEGDKAIAYFMTERGR
jgi:hypothetical protein